MEFAITNFIQKYCLGQGIGNVPVYFSERVVVVDNSTAFFPFEH